jgi:poly-gamma-glutamate capsule biosynthesis protein CapA/YwtB (metallophosphatase superfamily)/outer membrane protein assembly factor BamB
MRRRALRPLLAFLAAAWSLTSCGPTATGPVAQRPTGTAAVSPTPVSTHVPRPTPALTASRTPRPTASPSPADTPAPTATHTASPTATPAPTATHTASPTATASPAPPGTPTAGDPLPLSLQWRFDANGHLTAGAATRLSGQPGFLLTSLGRTAYALTAGGERLWRAQTSGPIYALAVLEGGRVAVGDDAGHVTLLDEDGRRVWRRELGSRVTDLLGGWEGGVLAGGWDERLTFLHADGEVGWAADLGSPISGVAGLAGLAIAGTMDGGLRAYDVNGGEAWRLDLGVPVTSLEARGEGERGQVLVGAQDGRLLAVDGAGALRWQQRLGTGGPTFRASDLAGDGDLEVVAGTGGTMPTLALLTASGEILWQVAVPAPVGAVTTVDLDGDGAGEILAGLSSGLVQAYNGQGRLRGAVHAGLAVWGLETMEDGTALVLADVVAWRLAGVEGSAGGAWLPAPAMLDAPPDLPRPDPTRAPDEAILAFLGDVAPGRSMEAALARYGAAYPWEGLGWLLQEADLAVANLESALTTQGVPQDKLYLIRAHPRWGETLTASGLDVANLANNHALDYGQAGLEETLGTLEGLGIAAVGAGTSRQAAHRPALFTLDGVRVAVLGYAAARWNGSVDVPATDRLAWAEPEGVRADVLAVGSQADVVVVLLHAGSEYAAGPSADQVAAAHAAVDAGADLVVGHHPHVTQTVERYGEGLIVYSLGDALFDIPRAATRRGHLLRVHVGREGLVQAELWPFWIDEAIQPRLLDDGQGGPRVQVIYP